MTTTCENLQAARKLIENPQNWVKKNYHDVIQRRFRRDIHQYCLLGAINVARGVPSTSWDREAPEIQLAAKALGHESLHAVYGFNDLPSTTHADVLNVLDKAIELCHES
jgi:hypothetical protein